VPIFIFSLAVSNIERWRVGGYFLEYAPASNTPFMWAVAAFYFLVHGGGPLFPSIIY